ncbi:MAG: hypothetical protein ABI321_06170 [Polyangia bacterium]
MSDLDTDRLREGESLLGHKSTRMVDLVYGVLDEETLRRAVERLPGGCVAGVHNPIVLGVTGGMSAPPPPVHVFR